MATNRLTARRKEALTALLDDVAPTVRQAMIRELTALEREGIRFLKAVCEGENRILALHASWFLHQLHFVDPIEDFREFIRSLHYELETGAILLNRTVAPDLDVGAICQLFDRIAARCQQLMFPPMSAREKCRVINRVLFHEYGFSGNLDSAADAGNYLLNDVLRTRRGLPITLGIVYVLVGQRCELDLELVHPPGLFLVGCFEEEAPFFVDPYARGTLQTASEVLERLRKLETAPKLSYLAPAPVRTVLYRCCRYLSHHYSHKDPARSRLFASFLDDFETAHNRNIRS